MTQLTRSPSKPVRLTAWEACRAGELLRARERFVGLRVDRVIDALDPDQSQLVLFRSSGRVMDIERHVFLPERIGDTAMFRLPEFDRAGWIHATQEYVDAVTATRLQEAAFDLLWTDAV